MATPATVADLDGDGTAEVLAALAHGTVVCLNHDGQPRWTHPFGAPSGNFKTVAAADLLPGPGLEVLAGCDDGWVNCLSADGTLLWRFFGDKYHAGAGYAVADVDGDGAPEIVYGTDNGHVYCLNGWGQVEWRYFEFAPYGRSAVNVADLDGDGRAEVLLTRSNVGNATCLMALDGATGAFQWRTVDVMQGYASNATVDLDGDGKLEVLHADKGNHLYCENADGSRRWVAELNGRGIFWAPCVADVDGDGHLEIISAMRGQDPETKACTFIVGDDGQVRHALELGTGANASPAAGDIDGDGELELIVATEGPPQIQALTWHAPGRVAWPSLRGNSRMTAHGNLALGEPGPRMIESVPYGINTGTWRAPARPDSPEYPAFEFSGRVSYVNWGMQSWTLGLTEPAKEHALLEVIVSSAHGAATEARIVDLKPGETSGVAPVHVAFSQEAEIAVRILTPDADNPTVARNPTGATTIAAKVLPPSACSLDQVRRACDAAAVAGHADAGVLKAQLAMLRGGQDAIRALAESEAPAARIADAATALRASAASLEALAKLLGRFWAEGGAGRFVYWADPNPWDPFDPKAVPDALEMERPVEIAAYGNEFENVALTLRNITPEPLEVRCMFMTPQLGQQRPEGEPDEPREHVTLRRLVPVPTAMQDRVFDALPGLDRSRSITLPPGEARQLWIEIKTHGLEPGVHEWTLYLGSLTKPPTVWAVPLRVEVWPVALPTDVFDKMNWSNFNVGQVSEQAVQDMVDHCMSVIYGPPLPPIPVDGEGALAGEVDWARFDETLARVPKHFTLLWGGPPPRQWPEGVAPDEDSDAHFAGFRTAIHVLAAHLAEHGFGYDQWAFYPIDEPWNTGFTHIPHLRRFCERVKRAEPRAQNYTDPCGLVRVEYLDEFKDLIDVWQPELNTLKRDPRLVEWFQQNAKRFWAYEAPGPAKDWRPLGHYRGFGWLAWHFGLDGFGYWVYKGVDAWWPVDVDYSAVYQTNRDVVASRRWQADRDGIEDYRAFYVLEHEIQRARAAGHEAEAAQAEALIEQALDDVIRWQIGTIDEITRMTRDYEIDFELLCDYRRRIAEAIIGLRGITGGADADPKGAP